MQKLGTWMTLILWGTEGLKAKEEKQRLREESEPLIPRDLDLKLIPLELVYWKLLWREAVSEAKFLHFNNIRNFAVRYRVPAQGRIDYVLLFFELPEGINREDAVAAGIGLSTYRDYEGLYYVKLYWPKGGLDELDKERYDWRPAYAADMLPFRKIRMTQYACRTNAAYFYMTSPLLREGRISDVTKDHVYFETAVPHPEFTYRRTFAISLSAIENEPITLVPVEYSLAEHTDLEHFLDQLPPDEATFRRITFSDHNQDADT